MPKAKINFTKSGRINRHVLIEITKRCNLNCRHCFTSAGKRSVGELNLADWFLAIDDLTKSGFNAFTLSGGEPLLEAKKTIAVAKSIKAHHPKAKIYLFTNGLLLTPSLVAQIGPLFNGVMVSLDGTEESHDWIRHRTGSYQKTLGALSLLAKARIPVSLQSMVTPANINNMEDLLAIAEKYQVKAIRFSHVDQFGRARTLSSNCLPTSGFLKKLDTKIKKLQQKTGIFLTSNLVSVRELRQSPAKFRQPCLHILPDGSVLPWYGFPRKYQILKYPSQNFQNMADDGLDSRLVPFRSLLEKAETKAKSITSPYVDYDNLIARYLFIRRGGKNG